MKLNIIKKESQKSDFTTNPEQITNPTQIQAQNFKEEYQLLVTQMEERIQTLEAKVQEMEELNDFSEWITALLTVIVVRVNQKLGLSKRDRYTWDSLAQEVYTYVSYKSFATF